MKRLLAPALLAMLGLAACSSPPVEGDAAHSDAIKAGQSPNVAYAEAVVIHKVVGGRGTYCYGALISPTVVVTATSCTDGASTFALGVAGNLLQQASGSDVRTNGDLAVMTVDPPVTLSHYATIGARALAEGDHVLSANTTQFFRATIVSAEVTVASVGDTYRINAFENGAPFVQNPTEVAYGAPQPGRPQLPPETYSSAGLSIYPPGSNELLAVGLGSEGGISNAIRIDTKRAWLLEQIGASPSTPPAAAGPTTPPGATRLANLSTRGFIGEGNDALIAGFVVSGAGRKTLVIRALGPSLGLAGTIADPVIDLYDSSGVLIGRNDDWQSGGFASKDVSDAGLGPADYREAALATDLAPGAYTAVVHGKNGGSGLGLVEIYDRDALVGETSSLVNLSARARVGTGDQIMIAGFVVDGPHPLDMVVRALGPSLAAAGVSGSLANPRIEIVDSKGITVYQNDDWQTSPVGDVAGKGLGPSDAREAAVRVQLAPGAYTALVRGVDNGTGTALVEAYALP